MRSFALATVVFSASSAPGAGCGTDVDPSQPPPETTARATWYQDVAPIVSKHCMSCHQDGGIAPFSLTTYDDASSNAKMMLDQINQGAMPPFGAREEADCNPRFGWQDDPRLSSAGEADAAVVARGRHAGGSGRAGAGRRRTPIFPT